MGKKDEKSNEDTVTVPQAVEALLKLLEEFPQTIDVSKATFKYRIDVGLLEKVPWKGLPNIGLFDTWLQDGTGLDWVIYSIDEIEGSEYYNVVFLLAEEI